MAFTYGLFNDAVSTSASSGTGIALQGGVAKHSEGGTEERHVTGWPVQCWVVVDIMWTTLIGLA